MGTKYTNADGLIEHYGTRSVENINASVTSKDGYEGELIVDFDFTTTGSVGSIAADAANALIPAGSVINSVYMKVGTAWIGGTSLALDFEDSSGATTPAAGLAAVAQASLTANSVHLGAGAAIGAIVPSANSDVSLNTTVVGTFTAGTAKVVVAFSKARA
jgi:hypothetical protein